jgi:hypothetical protein
MSAITRVTTTGQNHTPRELLLGIFLSLLAVDALARVG